MPFLCFSWGFIINLQATYTVPENLQDYLPLDNIIMIMNYDLPGPRPTCPGICGWHGSALRRLPAFRSPTTPHTWNRCPCRCTRPGRASDDSATPPRKCRRSGTCRCQTRVSGRPPSFLQIFLHEVKMPLENIHTKCCIPYLLCHNSIVKDASQDKKTHAGLCH